MKRADEAGIREPDTNRRAVATGRYLYLLDETASVNRGYVGPAPKMCGGAVLCSFWRIGWLK